MSEDSNGPSPPVSQSAVCLHCGALVSPGVRVCPRCGNIHFRASGWPPAPKGESEFPAPKDPAVIRREVNDGMTLGCGGFILAWIFVAIGAAWLGGVLPRIAGSVLGAGIADFAPVAFFVTVYLLAKGTRPYWARGLGYSIVVGCVVALGALVVCSNVTWPLK